MFCVAITIYGCYHLLPIIFSHSPAPPGCVLQQLLPERGPDVPLRVGGSPQQGRAQDRQQHAAQPEVELQRGDLRFPDIASIINLSVIAARDLEIHSVSGEYITLTQFQQ